MVDTVVLYPREPQGPGTFNHCAVFPATPSPRSHSLSQVQLGSTSCTCDRLQPQRGSEIEGF